MRRPARALLLVALVVTACAGPAPGRPAPTAEPATGVIAARTLTTHRSPTCSCCRGHEAHLREAGWTVRVVEAPDVEATKRSMGVPEPLWSCHTSVVAGWVVEGHVPVAAIEDLLERAPDGIVGIALPGMPAAAPGMGGAPAPLEVVAWDAEGRVEAFGTY